MAVEDPVVHSALQLVLPSAFASLPTPTAATECAPPPAGKGDGVTPFERRRTMYSIVTFCTHSSTTRSCVSPHAVFSPPPSPLGLPMCPSTPADPASSLPTF
eukprot:scaffold52186_cov29-Tisochrysis_lutea.AAC.14